MIVLAVLSVLALLIWCYLAAFHARFWRTDVLLPAFKEPAHWPSVAIAVPARNEADLLPLTLPTLISQDYPGPFRVVVVDDRSNDGTGDLARALGGPGTSVIAGSDPPSGWTGKLWALQQGLESLRSGPPELILFTDADIAHPPDSLRRLVASAESYGLDLVSLMAILPARGRWERLLIPAFVYFFAQLYPFRRVNAPRWRTAAAAGGCLLVRRRELEAAGGLERIRGAVIDDVSLAHLIKGAGGRIWLGLGSEVRSVRPYTRLAEIWHMVARSAFTQLRYSYLLVGLTVIGLVLTYLVPPAALAFGLAGSIAGEGAEATLTAAAGSVAWALMAATYAPTLRHHGRPRSAALLLPAAATLYLLMTVDSARRHARRGGAEWKGRRYAS